MKNKLLSLFFSLAIVLLALSVKANDSVQYTLVKNIKYKTGPAEKADKYSDSVCTLDVYYPKNLKNYTTIIWLHGGALVEGQKEIPEGLKNKGFAIVGVGYRLYPHAKCPDYLNDAAASVAWVFNNIEHYGGNKTRIFVAGHSAGAYLTLMIGLDKNWLAQYNINANDIAGLLSLSGQTITHFSIRQEQNIPKTQPIINEYAPLFHVRADAPPILLVAGDAELETVGRYEENVYLARMLKVVGHSNTTFYQLQGFDHGSMVNPGLELIVNFVNNLKR